MKSALLYLSANLERPFNPLSASVAIETGQLICTENQLTGFYMSATLELNGLIINYPIIHIIIQMFFENDSYISHLVPNKKASVLSTIRSSQVFIPLSNLALPTLKFSKMLTVTELYLGGTCKKSYDENFPEKDSTFRNQ